MLSMTLLVHKLVHLKNHQHQRLQKNLRQEDLRQLTGKIFLHLQIVRTVSLWYESSYHVIGYAFKLITPARKSILMMPRLFHRR